MSRRNRRRGLLALVVVAALGGAIALASSERIRRWIGGPWTRRAGERHSEEPAYVELPDHSAARDAVDRAVAEGISIAAGLGRNGAPPGAHVTAAITVNRSADEF